MHLHLTLIMIMVMSTKRIIASFIFFAVPLTCGQRHLLFDRKKLKTYRNDLGTESDAVQPDTDGILSKRIVGGIDSAEGAWPWQVALLFKGKQHCAGALVTSEWVVTAAHCFGKCHIIQFEIPL